LGEITAVANGPPPLLAEGVAVDSHKALTTIKLHLTRSKTDPFGKGTEIYLGITGLDLCPVSALLQYMMVRPDPKQGPLFVLQNGQPLSRDQFVRHLKQALDAAGIDQKHYSGHSFRIGAATAAAKAGVPDHLIKAFGRWESEAYQIYIRTPPETLAALSSTLASSSN
jgi:site-specific recombinase XerD